MFPAPLTGHLVLENSRVRLAPLSFEFYDDIERIALNPSLWEFTPSRIQTHADLDQYLIKALTEKADGIGYPFVIIDKLSGEVAGATRYNHFAFEHKRVEIGWTWLARKFQGTGLNKAAKYELLRFAFEELGFNRVELKTDVQNMRSRRAILSIGAKEEGVFRHHMVLPDGRIRDTVYYSILQNEWPALRRTVFADFVGR